MSDFNENLPVNDGLMSFIGANRMVSEDLSKYKCTLDAVVTRAIDGSKEYFKGTNSRVNAGWTYQVSGMFVTPLTSVMNWMLLSSATISPAMGDTSLASLINANGCSPVQLTGGSCVLTAPTSVGGTGTVVFTHTFTCATAAQVVGSVGMANAASSYTLFNELALTPSSASLQVGDTLAITLTFTL